MINTQDKLECNNDNDNSLNSGISLVKELEDKWSKIKSNESYNSSNIQDKHNQNPNVLKMKDIFNTLREVNENRERRRQMKKKCDMNEFEMFIQEKKKELNMKFGYKNNLFNIDDFKKSGSVHSHKSPFKFTYKDNCLNKGKMNRTLNDNKYVKSNNSKLLTYIKQTQKMIDEFGKNNSNGNSMRYNKNSFSKYYNKIIMPTTNMYNCKYMASPKNIKIQSIYKNAFK